VKLPDFAIDRYEVSNWHYRQCVSAGACSPTGTRPEDLARHPTYPVIQVDAYQAEAYCRWLGRRLPLEAEWELAARGPLGRPWPWGDEPPTADRLNVAALHPGGSKLEPVTSYPAGATPATSDTPGGIFNLAGNVMEWTATEKEEYTSPRYDPLRRWDSSPQPQPTELIVRGGSFMGTPEQARPTRRASVPAQEERLDLGFRCVQ
jgi:formylglycine-generating enzyme required for sulfatase activity